MRRHAKNIEARREKGYRVAFLGGVGRGFADDGIFLKRESLLKRP
jgi:hypothetical protein